MAEQQPPGADDQPSSRATSGDQTFFLNELPDISVPFKVVEWREDHVPSTESLDKAVVTEEKGKDHPDKVRRHLALAVMWSLLGIYAVTIGLFLIDKFLSNKIPSTDLTAAIAAISGLQGLGAAIVGFYFGVKEKKNEE